MSLHQLQTQVHVAKDKRNDFGGYNYRTAEGILAAIKAALPDGAHIVVTDTMQEVAGQIFVTATATVTFSDGVKHEAQGHAMHPLTKKGMDPSQITGSASSYARKYALAGLVALDDGSADPDSAKDAYQPEPPKFDPAPFVEAIGNAMTGRALLDVMNSEGCDFNHADIVQARREKLQAILKGAQTTQAIDAILEHFAPDLEEIKATADARREELHDAAVKGGA